MKKLRNIVCILLAVAMLNSSALALTDMSLGGAITNNYTWDPTDVFVRGSTSDGQFRVVSYFSWDESNVNVAIDPVLDMYYTMEHYLVEDNGSATLDDLYTNVPYAFFDVEDDEGNNFYEELEVSCYAQGDSEPFEAGLYYFFDTTWHNYAYPSKNMTCAVRSQHSMYSILFGEMQAHYTEYHGQTSTFLIGKDDGTRSIDGAIESASVEPMPRVLTVSKADITGISVEKQLQTYQQLKNVAASAEEIEILENANVVVTFDTPLAESEVAAILREANAGIEVCTLKYKDENGMRITGWTDDISPNHLQEKLQHLQDMHDNVSYEGIVSAEVTMDLTDEISYNALVSNDSVYYADISDPVTRIAEKDYDCDLSLVVMDVSWQIES